MELVSLQEEKEAPLSVSVSFSPLCQCAHTLPHFFHGGDLYFVLAIISIFLKVILCLSLYK